MDSVVHWAHCGVDSVVHWAHCGVDSVVHWANDKQQYTGDSSISGDELHVGVDYVIR